MEPYDKVVLPDEVNTNSSVYNIHPADLPEMDWDESYDPGQENTEEKPKIEIPIDQVDDDSWWYSDAYTPDSKYEEWFLTTGHWLLKPRSRRYRGLFNPGHGHGQEIIPPTDKMDKCFRERCGDDDEDDFHSIHSFWAGTDEILSDSSSVESFNSLLVEKNSSEDEDQSKSFIMVKPSPDPIICPDLKNNTFFEMDDTNEQLPLNTHCRENKGDVFNTNSYNDEQDQYESHPYKFENTDNLGTRHLSSYKYEGTGISQSQQEILTNEIPEKSKSLINSFCISSNPFSYNQSNESLHSSTLGPFCKKIISVGSGNEIQSNSSIGQKSSTNPSLLLSSINSEKSSIISNTARQILSNENQYNQLTHGISECEFQENTKTPNFKNISKEIQNSLFEKQANLNSNPKESPEKSSKSNSFVHQIRSGLLCKDCRKKSKENSKKYKIENKYSKEKYFGKDEFTTDSRKADEFVGTNFQTNQFDPFELNLVHRVQSAKVGQSCITLDPLLESENGNLEHIDDKTILPEQITSNHTIPDNCYVQLSHEPMPLNDATPEIPEQKLSDDFLLINSYTLNNFTNEIPGDGDMYSEPIVQKEKCLGNRLKSGIPTRKPLHPVVEQLKCENNIEPQDIYPVKNKSKIPCPSSPRNQSNNTKPLPANKLLVVQNSHKSQSKPLVPKLPDDVIDDSPRSRTQVASYTGRQGRVGYPKINIEDISKTKTNTNKSTWKYK